MLGDLEIRVIALESLRPAGKRAADLMDFELLAVLAGQIRNRAPDGALDMPKTEWRFYEHA